LKFKVYLLEKCFWLLYILIVTIQCIKVEIYPGNGGTANGDSTFAKKISNINIDVPSNDIRKNNLSIAEYVLKNNISLVVIGPEQPLAEGLCDVLRERGIKCFGPSSKAAQIEASKAWSKEFMKRNNIPTAKFVNCTNLELAIENIKSMTVGGGKVVVKASGLAAGKIPQNFNHYFLQSITY